jgi:hypothetical protein
MAVNNDLYIKHFLHPWIETLFYPLHTLQTSILYLQKKQTLHSNRLFQVFLKSQNQSSNLFINAIHFRHHSLNLRHISNQIQTMVSFISSSRSRASSRAHSSTLQLGRRLGAAKDRAQDLLTSNPLTRRQRWSDQDSERYNKLSTIVALQARRPFSGTLPTSGASASLLIPTPTPAQWLCGAALSSSSSSYQEQFGAESNAEMASLSRTSTVVSSSHLELHRQLEYDADAATLCGCPELSRPANGRYESIMNFVQVPTRLRVPPRLTARRASAHVGLAYFQ